MSAYDTYSWRERAINLIKGREASVSLLLSSARRGMTRHRMEQIWGKDFTRIVLEEFGNESAP